MLSIVTATWDAAAQAAPEQKVAVRTFNYAVAPDRELAAAKSEAAHIFQNAGISIQWIDCWVPGAKGGAPCTEPLITGRDLMLRLVDRRPAEVDRIVALGESMLDGEQRGGVLMTVDMFPVRSVAAGASTSVSTLLGRAVAHEIGHLLLGTREHSRLGVMRALWTQDELRGLKPAHWGFSSREVARMRQGLRGKSRTAD